MISKNFLQSKTCWGALIILVQLVARWMGCELDDAMASQALDLLGVALVFYGRRKGARPVHFFQKYLRAQGLEYPAKGGGED